MSQLDQALTDKSDVPEAIILQKFVIFVVRFCWSQRSGKRDERGEKRLRRLSRVFLIGRRFYTRAIELTMRGYCDVRAVLYDHLVLKTWTHRVWTSWAQRNRKGLTLAITAKQQMTAV